MGSCEFLNTQGVEETTSQNNVTADNKIGWSIRNAIKALFLYLQTKEANFALRSRRGVAGLTGVIRGKGSCQEGKTG